MRALLRVTWFPLQVAGELLNVSKGPRSKTVRADEGKPRFRVGADQHHRLIAGLIMFGVHPKIPTAAAILARHLVWVLSPNAQDRPFGKFRRIVKGEVEENTLWLVRSRTGKWGVVRVRRCGHGDLRRVWSTVAWAGKAKSAFEFGRDQVRRLQEVAA